MFSKFSCDEADALQRCDPAMTISNLFPETTKIEKKKKMKKFVSKLTGIFL